jgi:hypothetical protein
VWRSVSTLVSSLKRVAVKILLKISGRLNNEEEQDTIPVPLLPRQEVIPFVDLSPREEVPSFEADALEDELRAFLHDLDIHEDCHHKDVPSRTSLPN